MILLIVSKYMDGEIRSIEGYATNDSQAVAKVKELNLTVAPGEHFKYDYEVVDKIVCLN